VGPHHLCVERACQLKSGDDQLKSGDERCSYVGDLAARRPPVTRFSSRRSDADTALVDSYDIQCGPVRQALIRYLSERTPAIVDYSTLATLVDVLEQL